MSRTAIVTGGTRGIGRGVALTLCEAGYDVVAVYRSNRAAAEKFAEELRALTPKSSVFSCDVGSRADRKALFDFVLEEYGALDVLVNNAGGGDKIYWAEATEAGFDREIALNLKSTYFMCRDAAAIMARRGFGRIVNAASIAAAIPDCCLTQYAAVKAGVRALTRGLAGELGPLGITVNAYAPGIVDTDVTHEMIEKRGSEQLGRIALGRFGRPEDIAKLVKFLVSDDADYITGQTIGCDGGMFAIQNQSLANELAQSYLSENSHG